MIQYVRFKHDFQLARFNYRSQSCDPNWPGLPNPPATRALNQQPRVGKGSKIRLTDADWKFVRSLNSQRSYDFLLIPKAGWINNGKFPECITFTGNAGIVVDRIARFTKLATLSGPADATYESNPALIHKMTVITQKNTIIKPGKGLDVYVTLITNGGLWTETEFLEFFPALPMTVMPRLWGGLKEHVLPSVTTESFKSYGYGQEIVILDYQLRGSEVWGQTESGFVCLYYPRYAELMPFYSKQTTTWRMETTPPPV